MFAVLRHDLVSLPSPAPFVSLSSIFIEIFSFLFYHLHFYGFPDFIATIRCEQLLSKLYEACTQVQDQSTDRQDR